jgi:hypothetical protein
MITAVNAKSLSKWIIKMKKYLHLVFLYFRKTSVDDDMLGILLAIQKWGPGPGSLLLKQSTQKFTEEKVCKSFALCASI